MSAERDILTTIESQIIETAKYHPILILDEFKDTVNTNAEELNTLNVEQGELINNLTDTIANNKSCITELKTLGNSQHLSPDWHLTFNEKLESLKKNIDAESKICKQLTSNTGKMQDNIHDIKTAVSKVESVSNNWKKQEKVLLKTAILELSGIMGISTKKYPISVNSRRHFKDCYEEFKGLCLDLIFKFAGKNSMDVWLCIGCWNILFIRESSVNPEAVESNSLLDLKSLLIKGKSQSQATLTDFMKKVNQAFKTNKFAIDQELINLVPGIIFSGDRTNEKGKGHKCLPSEVNYNQAPEEEALNIAKSRKSTINNKVKDLKAGLGNENTLISDQEEKGSESKMDEENPINQRKDKNQRRKEKFFSFGLRKYEGFKSVAILFDDETESTAFPMDKVKGFVLKPQ